MDNIHIKCDYINSNYDVVIYHNNNERFTVKTYNSYSDAISFLTQYGNEIEGLTNVGTIYKAANKSDNKENNGYKLFPFISKEEDELLNLYEKKLRSSNLTEREIIKMILILEKRYKDKTFGKSLGESVEECKTQNDIDSFLRRYPCSEMTVRDIGLLYKYWVNYRNKRLWFFQRIWDPYY